MKVRMATRHTAPSRVKLERGLTYELPDDYAQELIDHGIAVLVVELPLPVEVVSPAPGFVAVNRMPPKEKMPKIIGSKKETIKKYTKGN